MMRGAWTAVKIYMKVKAGEEVLVVTDTKRLKIAKALAYAATMLKAPTVIAIMDSDGKAGEPPKAVAAAMKAVEVAFLPTSRSLSTPTRAKKSQSKE